MINLEKVGSRIAMRRRERGLTQRQLAALMGVSPQAVSKWERGSAFPDPVLLDELAAHLGFTIEELLTGAKS